MRPPYNLGIIAPVCRATAPVADIEITAGDAPALQFEFPIALVSPPRDSGDDLVAAIGPEKEIT
jgi:hypothetical protein